MCHNKSCPDCGSKRTRLVGRIPATDAFAGRRFSSSFWGGSLYRCQECYLGFRWPRMPKKRLELLYVQGSEHNWATTPELRRDWCIARSWIRTVYPSAARVLDVGCFDGGFLDLLGNSYQRYGIEIHPIAKNRLATRGIKIVAADIDELSVTRQPFDCITCFDVIEHLESPKSFLSQCVNALKPSGHILISTGNLDAPTFRFMGSRYWYCTNAEHISFISPEWCHRVAERMGLRVSQFTTFAHGSTDIESRVKDTVKNIFCKLMPSFFAYLRKQGWGKKNAREHPELAEHPPFWGSASDHFMVLMSR